MTSKELIKQLKKGWKILDARRKESHHNMVQGVILIRFKRVKIPLGTFEAEKNINFLGFLQEALNERLDV